MIDSRDWPFSGFYEEGGAGKGRGKREPTLLNQHLELVEPEVQQELQEDRPEQLRARGNKVRRGSD